MGNTSPTSNNGSVMNKLASLSSILTLFFAAQLWGAHWHQSLPLQTPEEKAVAFLKIWTLIPSMADGAVRYGFDPVALFDHQMKIEKMMSHDPLFNSLRVNHKDLIEFSIFNENSHMPAGSAKEINWRNVQEHSKQFVKSFGINSDQKILEEIKKLLQSPLLGKSQGIIVGLSNLIPAAVKKDFFAMSLIKKNEILNQSLPSEIVSNGFVPAKLGWEDRSISKEEVIARLNSAVDIERSLTSLLIHHYSSFKNLTSSKDFSNDFVKDYLNTWKLDPNQKKILEQWFNLNVAKMIPTDQTAAEPSLILREVPPVVAIFRGFAGNDCSTQHSFPFVNSPNEFTFYVYDSKGAIKGYVQGTKVSVRGEASFYLHTIAGPRVSKDDALNIIKTFVQERHNLGFKEIYIPPMGKVENLVNFVSVREAFQQVMTDSAEVIEYYDTALRINFKETFDISRSHDDVDNNLFGHKIDETKLGPSLKIERKESLSVENASTQVDKNSLILMLFKMGRRYEESQAMIDVLAPRTDLSAAEVKNLITLIQNNEKLSSDAFIEKVERTLNENGFTFPVGYFKKNISVIALGLIQASDFFQDKDFVEKVLQNLLEQREIHKVEKILLASPELFRRTKLTISFLKSFYIDAHEAINKEPRALEVAIHQNPQEILQNGEILTMLLKNAKARGVLNTFLTENPIWVLKLSKEAGQALLVDRQLKIKTLSAVVKKALSAKTDQDFIKITSLEEIRKQLPYAQESQHLQNEIYIQTMDHFLSLKPNKSIYSVFSSLYTYSSKSDSAVRALRKLLPRALSNCSWELNNYLKAAADLKLRSQKPETVDNIVRDAILARADQEKAKVLAKKHFPDLEWARQEKISCEGLFSQAGRCGETTNPQCSENEPCIENPRCV